MADIKDKIQSIILHQYYSYILQGQDIFEADEYFDIVKTTFIHFDSFKTNHFFEKKYHLDTLILW